MNSFMDTFNATQARIEKEQDNRHRQNNTKLNALLVLATLFGALVALAGLYVAYQESRHQGFLAPLHSRTTSPVLAEESTIPALTRGN